MTRDLHLTSPLLTGEDVLACQQRLLALGFKPGACDGVFGPATAGAIAAFQRAAGLKADGSVGQVTRGALVGDNAPHAERRIVHRVRADGTVTVEDSVGERTLAEARKHVGAAEQPAGSNRQQFGEWIGVDGVPWSAIFVSYCYSVGAGVTLGRGYKGAGAYLKGLTYAPALEAWLHFTGYWLGRTEPQPGDIALISLDGGRPDRAGIVEEVHGDGSFTTIEGDSEAGTVERQRRTFEQASGFGRIEE